MFWEKTQVKGNFFIGLSLILVTSITKAEVSRPISYFEAVRLSLSSNPRIGASKAQIESAQAAITETRGAGLPKMGFEMNAARSDNPLNVFGYKLSQGNATFADFGFAQFTGPNSLYIKPQALDAPGYYSNYNTAFKLVVPIYSGGETVARLKNTNALLRAAQEGDEAARMQLAYDILQAYEGTLAANKMVFVAKKNVEAASSYLKLTKALFKQSLVIESDILLADSYLRTAKTFLVATQAEYQNHLDEFRSLVGHGIAYTPKSPVNFPATKKSLTELMQDVLVHNAQLRTIKSTIEAGQANIDVAKAANKPQVNLQLRQDWNGNTLGAGYPSNLIAVGVNWELFSSGEHTGATKKAIANVKQATFQLEDTANSLRLSLIQAKRAEQLADIQYQSYRANANQAKEVIGHLSKRFGRGLVPLGQLLESQIKLTQSQNQCIQSQYNQVLARGRMLMLTNKLIPAFEK
ncbi:TolC family protein [Fluoribacter dumoffii]|uniref:TolC family protein n=1 Tax=Fluoribacter dumoffii TaxID=463 RepID=UPI0022440D2D|nr:TolC family protein [Fluoribacter dumoffii]MCW8418500.1 TolC family protein [Fluoribacter dumoffii]MCW8453658.1 TolC family protein [Fluoribacter dumoffii]MCW8459124.1 TolC family protein [Fluoribacter dumoffii]MCW8482483.1 TolC family protein [Fluoribacter dumoffii]